MDLWPVTIHCAIRLQASQEEDMRRPDMPSKEVETTEVMSCEVAIQSLGHTKVLISGHTSHLMGTGMDNLS